MQNCIQGFNPQALFYFDLAEASRVRLSSSGNANIQLSTRTTCDEPASQTACEASINAVAVADLEAGRHYVIVESDGQTTLNLEINPDEGGDSPFVDFVHLLNGAIYSRSVQSCRSMERR